MTMAPSPTSRIRCDKPALRNERRTRKTSSASSSASKMQRECPSWEEFSPEEKLSDEAPPVIEFPSIILRIPSQQIPGQVGKFPLTASLDSECLMDCLTNDHTCHEI